MIPHPTASNHNGGQLQFGPDGLPLHLGRRRRQQPVGERPEPLPACSASSSGSTRAARSPVRGPRRQPVRGHAGATRSTPTGCGTRTASRSTARPATSRSATSARAPGRRSTSSRREAGSGPTSAGPASRGPASAGARPRTTRPPCTSTRTTGFAAITGGFVIRDSALPSLQGRYIYADYATPLGNQIRTIDLGGGAGSDAPLGLDRERARLLRPGRVRPHLHAQHRGGPGRRACSRPAAASPASSPLR